MLPSVAKHFRAKQGQGRSRRVAFFVDWRHQSQQRHQEALKQTLDNKEQGIDTVMKQKHIIAQQNLELQHQFTFVSLCLLLLKKLLSRMLNSIKQYN